MKTVRDACALQANALSIKLSDQIEQLDELIATEADGAAFFEKTHITQGMQDLISEGIARLAGCEAAFVGGPVALAWSRFDAAVRERVRRRYVEAIAPWRDGVAYRVPGEFVIVSARAPA